jgi:2-polyprenyl-3-methyl-5-hydroxy-6-metoxy-1,4-benzoquinol methylase
MAQRSTGFYSVLSLPTAYTLFERAIGALKGRATVLRESVRPRPGQRILDIGCGPGDVLGFLPPGVRYVGFDESKAYIHAARTRFGHRGEFYCERVEEKNLENHASFDIVLAFGILHHLDDTEALHLFRLAHHALKPGGSLFTLDGCYTPNQSPLARWLLSMDRGKNVRTEEGYRELAATTFADVRLVLRHDLFRIPYTLLVLECRRGVTT